MKAIVILLTLVVSIASIANVYASHDTPLEETIEDALKANFIDETEAENAAHDMVMALQVAGFVFNQANADLTFSIIPDKDTDLDFDFDEFSVLVCISNNGFPVPSLGLSVWCATYTNNSDVDSFEIWKSSPSTTTQINNGALIPPLAQAYKLDMNEPGHWQTSVKYSDGTILEAELEVSWMVLPESAIGAVAIIGAGIASVAVYGLRKHRL